MGAAPPAPSNSELVVVPPDFPTLPASVQEVVDQQIQQRFGADGTISDRVEAVLETVGKQYKGYAFELTKNNDVPKDWLQQTPNLWNRNLVVQKCTEGPDCDPEFQLSTCTTSNESTCPVCEPLLASIKDPAGKPKSFCLGSADRFVDNVWTVVSQGGTLVDVSTLSRAPDGRFLAALRNAITVATKRSAQQQRRTTVRILIGHPYDPIHPPAEATRLLGEILRDAKSVVGAKIGITVAAYNLAHPLFPSFVNWNHSKILANDTQAMVGGHNMWTADYLLNDPVHDLSMRAMGPSTRSAHEFLQPIWAFVCRPDSRAARDIASYDSENPKQTLHACLTFPPPARPSASGPLSILAVGNYDKGIVGADYMPVDMDLVARDAAIGLATKTVKVSQQDLGNVTPAPSSRWYWEESTLHALTDAAIRGVKVNIVLSNYGTSYSNGIVAGATAQKLLEVANASKIPNAPKGHALQALLCKNLALTTLRLPGPENQWPDGQTFANHAKFYMIDDQAFYIGSDNFYPAWLQEYGYLVDEGKSPSPSGPVATLAAQYWDPLWNASKRVALSGEGAKSCAFRCEIDSPANTSRGPDLFTFYADVNGDHRADFCQRTPTPQGDTLRCALTDDAGFRLNQFTSGGNFDFGDPLKGLGFVDVNGDGKADYCRVISNSKVLSCAIARTVNDPYHGTFRDGQFEIELSDAFSPLRVLPGFADVNGDGYADYCRVVASGQLSCALAVPSSDGVGGRFVDGTFKSGAIDLGWDDKPHALVDVNGDGKADFCRLVGGQGNSNYVSCALAYTTPGDPLKGGFRDGIFVSDIGVGGKLENRAIDAGWADKPRVFVDVNGDGRADFCRFVGNNQISCALSHRGADPYEGGGFFDALYNSGPLDPGWSDKPRVFVDVNGDRSADFCRFIGKGSNDNYNYLSCAIARTGEDGFTGYFEDGKLETIPIDTGWQDQHPVFVDASGDGSADFCRVVDNDVGKNVVTCFRVAECAGPR